MNNKLLRVTTAAALLLSTATALPFGNASDTKVDAASDINYASALQMSLYFFECQQAGTLPEWNRVEWRGDAITEDVVNGGWYDAGDHVKFNLPMAYTASMLAWGLYQYPDGVEACGEMTNYVNNLTWTLDYLAGCDLGDEVIFQMGNGQQDHTWWGPVELYSYGQGESAPYTRPYYTASSGCSAVFGDMAAALAAGAAALDGKVDDSVRADYIAHAENIYKLAATDPSNDFYNDSDASNFYRSKHFYDELFYAANWLYIATGEQSYLDEAKGYISHLDKELGSSELKYSWAQCWDDVMQGGMLLYAQNSKDPTYINQVQKHLDYWCASESKLPGGLCYVDTWGCLRYANAVGFIAAVATDTLFADDAAKVAKYKELYETQINYTLGDNPDGRAYVVGYNETSPKNPHHRTAHCSWNNSTSNPSQNRHMLYGAVVGGPNNDGSYVDDRENYINNEVADDYNAGYTGLLCKMVSEYGGKTDPAFPPKEVRTPEFFVEAMAKQASDSGVSISLKFTNVSAWPARVEDNLSFRYYMDLTEVIDAGFKASDVAVRCDRDQSAMYSGVTPAVISELKPYKDNVYYIEVSYPDGRAIIPVSEGRYQCETLLSLVFPNYGSGWDSSNDYSFTDIGTAEENTLTDKIPVYLNGKLLYGVEPDGTTPDISGPVETTTKPVETTTTKPTQSTTTVTTTNGGSAANLPGDVDSNGVVSIADVVRLARYISQDTTLEPAMSAQQIANADVDGDEYVDASDISTLSRKLAGLA